MKKFYAYIMLLMLGLLPFVSFAYENNEAAAKQFVSETSDKVIAVVKSSSGAESKENSLQDIFVSVTDIDWIGKFVLGKYWHTLSDDQKVSYVTNYRNYLIKSYVPLFREYNGQSITIREVKTLSAEQYLVVTDIKPRDENSSPIRVEYRLKYDQGSYKIRDIVAEGVSMIATQRSEFASIINNSGFAALVDKLKDKA